MSRYVLKDFGYMSMIRQHTLNTHYEMAFPPVFPFLMAILNCIFDMGIMSAIFLNFLFGLILIAIIKNIGDYTGYRLEFSIAFFSFICTALFRSVFQGGLTQLLGFVFFTSIMRLVVKRNFSERDCFLTTLIAGFGLMNRFDFFAIAGIILVLTPFRVNICLDGKGKKIVLKDRLIWLCINVLILITTCFPWIYYSITKFGKLFITDNGRRLINIEDTRPSTYFSVENPARTIFDDFSSWFSAFKKRGRISYESLKILINQHYLFKYFATFFLCIIVLILIYYVIKERFCFRMHLWLFIKDHFGPIIITLSLIGQEITIIFTGYEEGRYHILFLFWANVLLFISCKFFLLRIYHKIKAQEKYKGIITIVISAIVCLPLVYDGWNIIRNSMPYILSQGLSGEDSVLDVIILNEREKAIGIYLYEQNASCVVINRNERVINVPRTCSLIHTAAMISPSNINRNNAEDFIKDFDIDYIFSSEQEFNNIFFETVKITETPIEFLYKVDLE